MVIGAEEMIIGIGAAAKAATGGADSGKGVSSLLGSLIGFSAVTKGFGEYVLAELLLV